MTETKIAEKTDNRADATKTENEDKPKLFNLPQIAGGALAAVTTAAVGSRLGVAGTLAGAAIASVLAAFASTLYTKGLEHTRDGVKKIVLRDGGGKAKEVAVDEPAPARKRGWGRRTAIAGGMLATAAVSFVVAMGLVTGWEFSTGQSLDGRNGTTISQVGTKKAASKPTPSASATPTASATPSATASSTPSASPTASETPTATPTPSASETPSAAAPSTAKPTQSPADAGNAAAAG
ncbi:MAG: hypothetical protein QM582_08550 [Micropruina sp.]|uniref:hypothetical protein n=1 Tax=Micropruina sp. TaxID=2737536 RepID=UPI0039E40F41